MWFWPRIPRWSAAGLGLATAGMPGPKRSAYRRGIAVKHVTGSSGARVIILAMLCLAVVASAQEKRDPALDKYYIANSLCSRRFYKLAVAEYKEFLTKYPKHAKVPKAKWGLAISLYNLGNSKEAEPLFKGLAASKEIPDQEMLHNLWGSCLLEQKSFPEAEKAFTWSIKNAKDPASARTANARVGLIEALYLQNKWADVINVSDEMLKAAPKSPHLPKIRYEGAVARAKLKQYAPAVKVFQEIVEGSKDVALVHRAIFQQAECKRQTDKLAEATDLYETAAKTKKGIYSEYAHYNLGLVLFLQKKYVDAITELTGFQKAYAKTKLHWEAKLYIGRAHLELRDYKKAQSVLKQLTNQGPVAAAATLWLARTHARRNDHAKVVGMLTPAVADVKFQKDPSLSGMLYELAAAHMNLRKYEAAAGVYARARAVGKGDELIEFHRLQAYCLHRAGKFAESMVLCDAFLKKYPKHAKVPDVILTKAENLMLLKKEAQALPLYDKFLSTAQKHKDANLVRLRRAQIYAGQKKWASAVENLVALLEGDHTARIFDQAWFLAGDCYLQLKEWDKAIEAFEAFIKEEPNQANIDTAMCNLSLAHQRKDNPAKAIEILTELITEQYGWPITERSKPTVKGKKPKRIKKPKGPARKKRPEAQCSHLQKARVELGRLLYEAGRLDEARNVLLDALETYQRLKQAGDGNAEYYLGWIALKQDRQDHAAKYFAALGKFPKHPFAADAALQAAIVQIRNNSIGPALKTLQKLLLDNPQHPKADQATYYVGLCYARLGKYTEALPYFKTVLSTYATSDKADNAMYWQARCQEKGDKETGPALATETLKAFLKKFPKSEMLTDAILDLSKLEYDAKEYDQVIERMTEVLGPDLDKPVAAALRNRALYLLGWSYFKTKKMDAGAKAFEAMTKTVAKGGTPTQMTPSAYFQAGEARMRLKEYAQALEHFSKAVSTAKPASDIHASSLLRRAECEALMDKWKESQATAGLFLSTYAKHKLTPRGHFTLGWAMENQKQYPKAIESYRVVTAGGKNNALTARAQFQIGECFFAGNKLDEAVKELVRVESKYSFPEWSSKAILELGRVREAQDMEEEAMARYKEVITRFPKTAAATVAKNLLKKLD